MERSLFSKIRKKLSFSSERLYFGEQFETIDFFRQSPYDFLSAFAPNRIKLLKRILNKIKFAFKGNFIVDLTLPMNVGGYCTLDNKIIAINPMLLLSGSEKDIAHVLFHEGLHAGVYTPEGIDDEALVETMTKKKMKELYGGKTLQSGYDEMVNEISNYFGDMSFNEMTELIEGGDEDTFDNLLELMIVEPSIKDGAEALSWEDIKSKLGKKWSMFQRLFPRIINSIAKKNVGVHAGTNVSLHHFKLDGLLEKTARKLLEKNPDVLNQIFKNIYRNADDLTEETMIDLLYLNGFGYLYDYDSEFINKSLRVFLSIEKLKYIDFSKMQLSKDVMLAA